MAILRKQKRTPQELQLLGGSCLYCGGPGRRGVLRLCIISVYPLAQVVADYAGRNGNNKGDYIFHENPPSRWKESQQWK